MKMTLFAHVGEKIAETLKIPNDLFSGEIQLYLCGSKEIRVENYRGILEYTEQRILLQTKKQKISIEGKKLHILYYTKEEMKVVGTILSIRILDGGDFR